MIEIGDYVRLKNGKIIRFEKFGIYRTHTRKINGKYETGTFENKCIISGRCHYKYDNIVKHSKNIIDLIEDEDIVILEYKTPKYRERIERKFIVCKIDDFINFENRNCNFTYKVGDKKIVDKICKNIKIKGVLTTEQFNNEYYRLEE